MPSEIILSSFSTRHSVVSYCRRATNVARVMYRVVTFFPKNLQTR